MVHASTPKTCRCAASTEYSITCRTISLRGSFLQGFLTNALNPKVALFYLAALPQFASGPEAPLMGALLIGIHGMFGATWLSIVAFAASRARAITWNAALVRWLDGAIGVFFLGVAGRLALDRN